MGFLSDWSDVAKAQLAGAHVRAALLMRVRTEPIMRMWGGVGYVEVPAGGAETDDGAIYSGMGELLGLPVVSQLLNGASERITFSLAGTVVTGELAAIASTSAADVRGAAVSIGFFVMDDDWQRISPVAWPWRGLADMVSVDRATDQGRIIRTISLSVGSLFTGRKRPDTGYWSDPDQRRRSPTDTFCDRVKTYEQGTTKVWPE